VQGYLSSKKAVKLGPSGGALALTFRQHEYINKVSDTSRMQARGALQICVGAFQV
jgi:hypothetical protein